MDFIFMLTRGDKTIEDCLALFEEIRPAELKHVGFKDVGVSPTLLEKLTAAVRASGAISYMEVVSTTAEASLNSARIARDLGVDRLLGGTQVDEVLSIVAGSNTAYYPFPGHPQGHPTRLGGSAADIEMHCRSYIAKGAAGVDLLAYRATEADPLDLVRAARRGVGERELIVAGSVTSAAQIKALAEAGADAFTIGSAVFDGSFNPRKGSVLSQLRDVLDACAAAG
jgi:hypothetical protein